MKVRFTERAADELENIVSYLQERSPTGALNVQRSFRESLGLLSQYPGVGRRQSVDGIRKLKVSRYPYLIYYSIEDATAEILILAIRHAACAPDFTDD
jgi:toxin ParE1/3/4